MNAKLLLTLLLILEVVIISTSTQLQPESVNHGPKQRYLDEPLDSWPPTEDVATIQLQNPTDLYWMFLAKSLNLTEQDLELSYETMWSNGSRTVTLKRTTNNPVERRTLNPDASPQTGKKRTKRSSARKRDTTLRRKNLAFVFGTDERKKLPYSSKAQKFPHSAACKLSCGRFCTWSCSGILIGLNYVLTSAHCLDGKDTSSLEVGFLQQNGRLQWYDVLKANVPLRWTTEKEMIHDYAVLQLHRQPNRPHVSITSMTLTQGSMMSMTGFPGDKAPRSLWTSKCRTLMVTRELIWNQCDAARGNSGSGMFVKVDDDRSSRYAVVGVFSGARTLTRRRGQSTPVKRLFNVAVRLTGTKVSQINEWTKS